MRITKERLKQIIKEELESLVEQDFDERTGRVEANSVADIAAESRRDLLRQAQEAHRASATFLKKTMADGGVKSYKEVPRQHPARVRFRKTYRKLKQIKQQIRSAKPAPKTPTMDPGTGELGAVHAMDRPKAVAMIEKAKKNLEDHKAKLKATQDPKMQAFHKSQIEKLRGLIKSARGRVKDVEGRAQQHGTYGVRTGGASSERAGGITGSAVVKDPAARKEIEEVQELIRTAKQQINQSEAGGEQTTASKMIRKRLKELEAQEAALVRKHKEK